ncbi:MAG: PEGA domain-containing protein [Lachnospiraceae bacterium]|nr:PEGA domain-containing protein [Lachnospiraceae bacterium]
MKEKEINKSTIFICLVLVFIMLAGCGGDPAQSYSYRAPGGVKKETASDSAQKMSEDGEPETADSELISLYIIENLSSKDETITVENVLSGQEYRYQFSLATAFLNKYDSHAPSSDFKPGMIVELGEQLDSGALSFIKKTDKVWEYEQLSDYKIDLDRETMTIDGKEYSLPYYVPVFSGRLSIAQEDIDPKDVLRVYGSGKEVFSIAITTGQGYLSLINTDLFVGSLIQIGKYEATLITGDMKIEVPQGKHEITVANKGYGGTKTVRIKRGKTTTLDLDKLKGEGPKTCALTFKVNAKGAKIYLDDEEVKAGKTVNVAYGIHTIDVELEGYETWTRTLYVNSASAEISLDPTEGNGTSSDSQTQTTSNAGSGTASENSRTDTSEEESEDEDSSEDDTREEENEVTLDYLTTLSDSLANLVSD